MSAPHRPGRGPRRRGRAATVLAAVAAQLLVTALPALADPAGPTDYRSAVTAVEGDGEAAADLEVRVLGGDAFLAVAVPEGTTLAVPGYDDEPYVRIREDGVVEVNQRSPSHWYNEERYGAETLPSAADAEAEPIWREAAEDGEYAWHDHRIHRMTPSLPEEAQGRDQPLALPDWEVPLRVDGEDVVVTGELVWHPSPPAWQAVGLVVGAGLLGLALLFVLGAPPALVVVVGAVPAAVAAVWHLAAMPPGAEGDIVLAVLPVIAAVVALLGHWLVRRDLVGAVGRLLAPAAGIPLLLWGVLQAGALTRPVVPEPPPTTLTRVLAAAALGLGAAALAWLVRAGLQAMPDPLADVEEPGAG